MTRITHIYLVSHGNDRKIQFPCNTCVCIILCVPVYVCLPLLCKPPEVCTLKLAAPRPRATPSMQGYFRGLHYNSSQASSSGVCPQQHQSSRRHLPNFLLNANGRVDYIKERIRDYSSWVECGWASIAVAERRHDEQIAGVLQCMYFLYNTDIAYSVNSEIELCTNVTIWV